MKQIKTLKTVLDIQLKSNEEKLGALLFKLSNEPLKGASSINNYGKLKYRFDLFKMKKYTHEDFTEMINDIAQNDENIKYVETHFDVIDFIEIQAFEIYCLYYNLNIEREILILNKIKLPTLIKDYTLLYARQDIPWIVKNEDWEYISIATQEAIDKFQ